MPYFCLFDERHNKWRVGGDVISLCVFVWSNGVHDGTKVVSSSVQDTFVLPEDFFKMFQNTHGTI